MPTIQETLPDLYKQIVKQPKPKLDLWTTNNAAATYASGQTLEVTLKNYTSKFVGEIWDQKTKASLDVGLTEIIKDYTRNKKEVYTAAATDIWDTDTNTKYNIVTSAGNDLWYNVPDNDNTITMTGKAGLYIYADDNTSTIASGNVLNLKPPTKEERFRQQLRQRLMPQILFRRFGVGRTTKDSEKKAREALRAIIGEVRFKRYLKHGFLTVRGVSGHVYQVFPGHRMTHVWKDGKPVEKLCIVFCDSSVPPTDSVIMRLLMILDSEEEFRRQSNVMGFSESEARQPIRIAA